jgi:hypothetical protein
MHTKFWSENQKGRNHLTLRRRLEYNIKVDVNEMWREECGSREGIMASCYEHGNDPWIL